MKKYDLHMHSKYSLDSFSKPRDIIKQAAKLHLTGVAITDHNTIKGNLEASAYAKKLGVDLILGEEISTSKGHVSAYFLTEEISPGSYEDVIDAIKEQGGIACIPHPFRRRHLSDEDLTYAHALEVYNSKNSVLQNSKALKAAKRLNIPMTGGSDAHCIEDIGKSLTIVKEDLRKDILKGKSKGFGTNKRWLLRTQIDIGRAILKIVRVVPKD